MAEQNAPAVAKVLMEADLSAGTKSANGTISASAEIRTQ
jgi:hypothetical protein